jgi:hypothetical protein
MHGIGAAFYSFWQLAVLKTSNQWAIAVRSIIYIEEVIVWFYAKTKTGEETGGSRMIIITIVIIFTEAYTQVFKKKEQKTLFKMMKYKNFPDSKYNEYEYYYQ